MFFRGILRALELAVGVSGKQAFFNASALTADRAITLPDSSGTLARTADIPALPLAVASGGTGSTTAAAARTTLGVGIYDVPQFGSVLFERNYPYMRMHNTVVAVDAGGRIRLAGNGVGAWEYQINTAADGGFSTVVRPLALFASGRVGVGGPSDDGANALQVFGGLTVSTAYKRGNVQVLGARITGWGSPTGAADRTAFATYTAPTISNPPTQAEVQALANHVQLLSRHLKALTDDCITHGFIGA